MEALSTLLASGSDLPDYSGKLPCVDQDYDFTDTPSHPNTVSTAEEVKVLNPISSSKPDYLTYITFAREANTHQC